MVTAGWNALQVSGTTMVGGATETMSDGDSRMECSAGTMGDKKKGASKEKICFTNSPISLELLIQF
jgi:hypothetical protein